MLPPEAFATVSDVSAHHSFVLEANAASSEHINTLTRISNSLEVSAGVYALQIQLDIRILVSQQERK